jgi:hypothetical protein
MWIRKYVCGCKNACGRVFFDECLSRVLVAQCLSTGGPSYVVVDGRVLLKEASISVASQAPEHQHDRRPGAH